MSSLNRVIRNPKLSGVSDTAKAALRQVGVATSRFRSPPDFLIIGAKRGGTTSLWECLAEHPGVLPLFPTPNAKGTYFLADEFGRGVPWWLSHFPTDLTRARAQRRLGYRPVAGDGSPYYLYHPLAPKRAAELAPSVVAIALLRNPIERTYSHWKERSRHTEELSFEDALAAEPGRTEGEAERVAADPTYVSFAHRHQSYLDQSRYAPMLRRWIDALGRDRLVVATAESFYADPNAFSNVVFEALGLPPHRVLNTEPRNAAPSSGMNPETRGMIAAELADDMAEVESLLGRPTGWS